jgi:hypothetical protein
VVTESIVDVIEAIIVQLTRLHGLDEKKLGELYKKYNADKPEGLNPKAAKTWDRILFGGNQRNLKLEKPAYGLIVEDALKYLGLIPGDLSIGDRSWLDYLKELRKRLGDPSQRPNPITGALATLFGMDARHYSVTNAAAGEFFGYRRSSNSGRIVRFHLKINPAGEQGFVTFENEYRQVYRHNEDHWIVRGYALDVGTQTYLLGQARDATALDTGLGLRFFVLNRIKYRWVSGLLSSIDRKGVPIASRVVLIPADQHFTSAGAPVTDILSYISEKVSPSDIEKQIRGSTTVNLKDVDVPTTLQSLIWNGTVRTVHIGNDNLPKTSQYERYRRVFEFQKLALARHDENVTDIGFFADLLSDENLWRPIKAKLAQS